MSNTNPEITIVIGTLNRVEVVTKLIENIIDISMNISLEVLVYDQSDEDNHLKLKFTFPDKSNFSLFRLTHPNTCRYLNLGWKTAKSRIVLYLDDDVSITEKAVKAHIDEYSDTSIYAVAGRVINYGERISKDDCVGKSLWYGAVMTKNFSYIKKAFVDFPYGCNMSYKKNILSELGGFDEQLAPPIYAYNEVDLGLRINHTKKNSIIFSPDAVVLHRQYESGGTRNDFSKEDVSQSIQFNYGYTVGKNYSWLENLIWFFRRLPYQILVERKAIPHILKGFMTAKKNQSTSQHATRAQSSKKIPSQQTEQ